MRLPDKDIIGRLEEEVGVDVLEVEVDQAIDSITIGVGGKIENVYKPSVYAGGVTIDSVNGKLSENVLGMFDHFNINLESFAEDNTLAVLCEMEERIEGERLKREELGKELMRVDIDEIKNPNVRKMHKLKLVDINKELDEMAKIPEVRQNMFLRFINNNSVNNRNFEELEVVAKAFMNLQTTRNINDETKIAYLQFGQELMQKVRKFESNMTVDKNNNAENIDREIVGNSVKPASMFAKVKKILLAGIKF